LDTNKNPEPKCTSYCVIPKILTVVFIYDEDC
jgi:hypothetical protein